MRRMKWTIVLLMLISYNSMHAQTKFKNVANAAEALRIAMVDGNGIMLAQLADDSLSYGHSSGHIDSKAAFVEKLQTGKSDFVSIDITDQRIQSFKKTALIRHTLTAVTNDNGKPGTVKLYVLQVWLWKDHTWKLIARQAVKAA